MQESIIQFKGKLDNLVGQKTAKGKLTLRKRVIPKNPRTSKQTIQRTKFDLAQATAATFRDAIEGWAPTAKSKRITLRNCVVGDLLNRSNPNAERSVITVTKDAEGYKGKLEYADLRLSRGSVEQLQYGPLRSETQNFAFSIAENPYDNATLIVVAYCQGQEAVRVTRQDLAKSDTTQQIAVTVPAKWTAEQVHVYAYIQIFNSSEEKTAYAASAFNSRVELFNAQAAANYSETSYLGPVDIG